MGKVYEALERAEREEQKRQMSAVAMSTPLRPAKKESPNPAGQFDFINYSLNALPAEEVARQNQEVVAFESARRSMVEPRRDVTLDLSRIDPHLTSFFDSNVESSLVASEQYNKLAISMITEKDERRLKKILVASTHHAEGRSCVALNLACTLARARQRVLVIDADLHRPSLLRLLGIEAEAGLTNVIKQDLAPGQAAIKLLPYGLDILPTREQVANAAEIFTSPRFREMLTVLEAEYDFILFDSSPLLRVNDANLLVRMTDATVFVIRSGKTSSLQLGKAIGSLTPEHIFGVVLNRAEAWANA